MSWVVELRTWRAWTRGGNPGLGRPFKTRAAALKGLQRSGSRGLPYRIRCTVTGNVWKVKQDINGSFTNELVQDRRARKGE